MSKKNMAVAQTLSEADKFFIESKVKEGLALEDIVKGVNKPESLVKDFAATVKVPRVKSQYEVARGNQTSQSGKAKVAVANQGMSQAADDLRKAASPQEAFKMKYADSMKKARDE